jgi:hypothetical protein
MYSCPTGKCGVRIRAKECISRSVRWIGNNAKYYAFGLRPQDPILLSNGLHAIHSDEGSGADRSDRNFSRMERIRFVGGKGKMGDEKERPTIDWRVFTCCLSILDISKGTKLRKLELEEQDHTTRHANSPDQ